VQVAISPNNDMGGERPVSAIALVVLAR